MVRARIGQHLSLYRQFSWRHTVINWLYRVLRGMRRLRGCRVGTQGWIRIEPVRGWHIEVAEEQPPARQLLSKGYQSLCGIRSGVCLAAGAGACCRSTLVPQRFGPWQIRLSVARMAHRRRRVWVATRAVVAGQQGWAACSGAHYQILPLVSPGRTRRQAQRSRCSRSGPLPHRARTGVPMTRPLQPATPRAGQLLASDPNPRVAGRHAPADDDRCPPDLG